MRWFSRSPRWYRSPWPFRVVSIVGLVLLGGLIASERSRRNYGRARDGALAKNTALSAERDTAQYFLTLSRLEAGELRKEQDEWKARVAASDARYAQLSERLDTLTAQLASMPLATPQDTLAAFPLLVAKCDACERAKAELEQGKAAADSARVKAEAESATLRETDSLLTTQLLQSDSVRADLASVLAKSDPPCHSRIPFTTCLSRKKSYVAGVATVPVTVLVIRALLELARGR